MPKITVITPSNRGVKQISRLTKDFKLQIYQDFEHIIVYDGEIPDDVKNLFDYHPPRNTEIVSIPKSTDMQTGTTPRNKGIELAKGEYVVFADDDDRYKSTYLETFMRHTHDNCITAVQMSCQESRMYRDGNPKRIVCIPEDLPLRICHVGTPCLIVKTEWARLSPWQDEPEHDFRFFDRIVKVFRPEITLVLGMQIDVDGLVIGDMDVWR